MNLPRRLQLFASNKSTDHCGSYDPVKLFEQQWAHLLEARPIECDNPACPDRGVKHEFYKATHTCSGCSGKAYCSPRCQEAAWASHQAECTVPSSVSTAGIDIRVLKKGLGPHSEESSEYAARTIHNVEIEIEYTSSGAMTPTKVGHAKLKVIDKWKARDSEDGFFDCLDECSSELGQLALHFDYDGRFNSNRGCWTPGDFEQQYMVYLEELVVDPAWRGKGVGRAIFPLLFKLDTHGAGFEFIFTFASVLLDLEPQSFAFDIPTPEQQAALSVKRERIIKFYRQSGFRRLANSDFFCLARDPNHASHSVPIDADADYEELPPPTTKAERTRRYMAYH